MRPVHPTVLRRPLETVVGRLRAEHRSASPLAVTRHSQRGTGSLQKTSKISSSLCHVEGIPSQALIGDVTEGLAAGEPEGRILELLTASSRDLIAKDLLHRLTPFATRLASLSYLGAPWAALVAGVAVCRVDRAQGRAILREGRIELEREGGEGVAFAWFLEGLEDLGAGDLIGASEWWSKARGALDPQLTIARLALAHLSLGAYESGDLNRAIVLAEEALKAAEQSTDHRAEAVAALYLGFFHLYTGRLSDGARLNDRAEAAFERVPVADRYELPLLHMERGARAALWGETDIAEIEFTKAVTVATADGNEWYTAIALTTRAEFTAPVQPIRAISDAQAALAQLEPIGESWWSHWARLALAVAHLHTGSHYAGRETCHELLEMALNPLERGRTLLVLAALAEVSGDTHEASTHASYAYESLASTGADYWRARASMLLARTDSRRAQYHRRAAQSLAVGHEGDPAWRTLLRGPGRLDIRVLGAASVTLDGLPVRFTTRAELEVLAMIAAAGGSLRTSLIGDRLWPDDDETKVSHRIDNLLSSLRRALSPTSRLRRAGGQIHLDLDPGECDLIDARREAAAALQCDELVDLIGVRSVMVELSRPLLGGLEVPWRYLEDEHNRRVAQELAQRTSRMKHDKD